MSAKQIRRAAGELAPGPEPSDFRRTFARNLRSARGEAGLSQRELAKLAGFSQKYIWEIEVGAKNVTLDAVTSLAKHLGKTELEMLTPKRR